MAISSDGGALAAYRASLADHPPLSEELERELTAAWRAGDRRAGDRLVCACLPFVVSIANEYRRWGVPIEDIIQQGNIGLLRAAARFDPAKQCRLVTYAAYWIRAEIREYVVRAYRIVRIGTTKSERRALRLYRTTREDDPAALAAKTGISEARAERLLPVLSARDVSLDVAGTGAGPTASERLAGTGPSPEDEASTHERDARAREALAAVMAGLSERERLIVRERWQADDVVTLERLGVRLGVSKERVRQIEERARAKLRAGLEALGYAGAA